MSDAVLEEKIKEVPQSCVKEVADFIDYICYRNKKTIQSQQDPDFAAVKAIFGIITPQQAEEIRSNRMNFSER